MIHTVGRWHLAVTSCKSYHTETTMAEVGLFNFSLKRDHHLNTLVSNLHSMFIEGRFVDFALAVTDGRFLKVHRVILCTFSRYFEDLLDKRPANFDFVMLNEVSFDDLTALVEFMYKGTVTVSQQQVPSFLKAASHLQIAGLSIHQSNLEVDTNHTNDIGFIEARQEDQHPAILHEKDPEDVTSTEVPIVTTESSEMTEEEEGDFRDGSLLVHQVTSFSSGLDREGLALISPMDDDVEEEDNFKNNSENAERIMMKDKENDKGEDESELSQVSSDQNKDNIPSDEEVEIPYSSPSTTVVETVDGISLRIPEQLGEDWMDNSDDGNGKENDVLRKATNVDCNALQSDAGELEDASSTTSKKQKEIEPARARKQATKKGKLCSSLAKRDPAVKQFKCSDCDSVYSQRSSLARHLLACGKTPSLQCTLCDYRARTQFQLEEHLKGAHKTAPEVQSTFPFKCDNCSRIFKLQRNLEKHLKKACEMVGTSTK